MKTPRLFSAALLGAFVLFSFGASGLSTVPIEDTPVGNFVFSSPADPPVGLNAITPMIYLFGTYTDTLYTNIVTSTVDMTTDPSGKVTAMTTLTGFTDKKQGTQLVNTLYLRTVNGQPVLTANANAGGTYNDGTDHATNGSGSASTALGTNPPVDSNNVAALPITASFTGKQDKSTGKEKKTTEPLFLDASQAQALETKSWYMTLSLTQTVDSKGKPFIFAQLDLFKPDGTTTLFAEKVTFSATKGYSFTLSRGEIIDPDTGSPKLDPKTNKPLIDKYSQIKFSNLKFKKFFNSDNSVYWEPEAGGVSFGFLGQKGFGEVFNFDLSSF